MNKRYIVLFLVLLSSPFVMSFPRLDLDIVQEHILFQDSVTTPTVTYQISAFSKGTNDGQSSFFLANTTKSFAATDADAKFQLARLVLEDGERAHVLPIATKLDGQKITQLALMDDTLPVIATIKSDGTSPTVQLLTNISGSGVLTDLVVLKDTAKKDVTKQIVGLTTGNFFVNPSDQQKEIAPKNYIFAAVPQNEKSFEAADATDRGIAVIEKTVVDGKVVLKQRDVSMLKNVNAEGKAQLIDLTVEGKEFAFPGDSNINTINGATIAPNASLWWDNSLERLYIGLQDVKRDDSKKEGGILGVGMGYVDRLVGAGNQQEFNISSIVQYPEKGMFFNEEDDLPDAAAGRNTVDLGVGFFFDGVTKQFDTEGDVQAANDGNLDVSISVPFVRTMHTSTDKHYLIVHSFIAVAPTALLAPSTASTIMVSSGINKGVYAFPLIQDVIQAVNEPCNNPLTVDTCGRPNKPYFLDPERKGTIARVNADKVPALDDKGRFQVPIKFEDMLVMTDKPALVGDAGPLEGAEITDMFVAGDAVYIAYKGLRTEEKGIFQSAAIFNKDGFISGWTPWQRVMGDAINVYGAGLDTRTGNFYMLTSANDKNPTKNNIINTGRISLWEKNDSLIRLLAEIFNQENGGVYQVFAFDEFTPGFVQNTALLVAIGSGTVALIQTGVNVFGQLTLTERFVLNENVFVLPAAGVGPLTSVEIQLNPGFQQVPDRLKIFVGGCNGLAALEFNQVPLINLKDSVAGASFVKLPAVTGSVYSLARSSAYEIAAIVDDIIQTIDFDGNITNPNVVSVPIGSDLVTVASNEKDKTIFIAGTENGIVVKNASQPAKNISGQVMQLQYLSSGLVDDRDDESPFAPVGVANGLHQQPGMIYALAFGQRQKEECEVVTSKPCGQEACTKSTPLGCQQSVQVYRLSVGSYSATGPSNPTGPVPLDDVVAFIDKNDDGSPKPFLQYDDFRTNISTDGSALFNLAPLDDDKVDFVRVTAIPEGYKTSAEQLATQNSLQSVLDLDEHCKKHFHVGIVKRDPGSGAWVLPGDWGIRVNH